MFSRVRKIGLEVFVGLIILEGKFAAKIGTSKELTTFGL